MESRPCPSGGEVVHVRVVLPGIVSATFRLVLLGVLILLLVPQGAFAHPPTDMQISSDAVGILSVTITHPVANPLSHYIRRVLVTAGGSAVIEGVYTSQPAKETFTYTYPIPPGVSGEVQVMAECSIAGSITRSFRIQGAAPTPPTLPAPPEAPVRSPAVTPPGGDTPPPAAMPTKAGPALLPPAAAAALAVWRFRR
jgi:hypothetical protein